MFSLNAENGLFARGKKNTLLGLMVDLCIVRIALEILIMLSNLVAISMAFSNALYDRALFKVAM